MDKIECIDLKGDKVLIDRDKLQFRISCYAVIVNQNKVLLVRGKTSNKYWYPGGGVEIYEKLLDALKREINEETGLTIKILGFIHFQEGFFFQNHWDKAFHTLRFYYLAKALTDEIREDKDPKGESKKAVWVSTQDLSVDQFEHKDGLNILQKAIKSTPRKALQK